MPKEITNTLICWCEDCEEKFIEEKVKGDVVGSDELLHKPFD